MRIRTYLIVAFAISLFAIAVLLADLFFAIMGSRVWIAWRNMGISEGTMASFEENIGSWVAAQITLYAILAMFGLTMASWILKDRAILEHLYEENTRLRKEIDEVKTKKRIEMGNDSALQEKPTLPGSVNSSARAWIKKCPC